jgi:hypothetical protein
MITQDGVKIQTGYKLRGLEPPDLASYDAATRKLFWGWVVDLGLRRKDKELSQGLDKNGEPLKPIDKYTREHRRSAMTPSGKGDPGAPPLTPGYQKSRTRSLLTGRAFSTHAEFFWLYDAWTGASWGVVLSYQAAKGRDVFGLSKAGTAAVKVAAWAKWDRWKAGLVRTVPTAKPRQTPAMPKFNQGHIEHIEHGVSSSGKAPSATTTGKSWGFSTPEERRRYFSQTADAVLPGRARNPKSQSPISGPKYNILLGHVHGVQSFPGRGGSGPKGTPKPAVPKTPPKPKPPAKPKPKTFEEELRAIHQAEQRVWDNPESSGLNLAAAAVRARQAVADLIIAHAKPGPAAGMYHGMETPEKLSRVAYSDINWFWDATKPVHPQSPITNQLIHLVKTDKGRIPERLGKSTKNVILTAQTNKHDPHWRATLKAFTDSLATGGDGNIVVYQDRMMTVGDFAHESGHNLAFRLYGSIDPTAVHSDYNILAAQAQNPTIFPKAEPAVSEYGSNNPAEDFATAVELYVDNSDKMKREFPRRFAIIDKIMTDPNYGG